MKVKIKVTGTITSEYEINQDYWPEAKSEEDMLKLRQEYLNEDASSLIEGGTLSDIKVERA